MKELLQMIKFVQSQTANVDEQAQMLAAFGPPPEDFNPKQKLPVQNELPAFSLKQPGVGSDLAGLDYGLAAPVFGQKGNAESTLGDLLTGDING